MLFNHIDELERTYTDLGEQINDPDIIANQEKWQKLMKEYSNMGPVVEKYREYKNALKSAEEAEEMLKESKDEESCGPALHQSPFAVPSHFAPGA